MKGSRQQLLDSCGAGLISAASGSMLYILSVWTGGSFGNPVLIAILIGGAASLGGLIPPVLFGPGWSAGVALCFFGPHQEYVYVGMVVLGSIPGFLLRTGLTAVAPPDPLSPTSARALQEFLELHEKQHQQNPSDPPY